MEYILIFINLNHECIKGGDNKYISIAASILAKVTMIDI